MEWSRGDREFPRAKIFKLSLKGVEHFALGQGNITKGYGDRKGLGQERGLIF